MSALFPKEKTIELIELLFQAGFDVETFKVRRDQIYVGIELQATLLQGNSLIKLTETLYSIGFELRELKAITTEDCFLGFEIKIRKNPKEPA